MDFAELNDLEVGLFDPGLKEKCVNTFREGISAIIKNAEAQDLNSGTSIGGMILKSIPLVGNVAIVLDKGIDLYQADSSKYRDHSGAIIENNSAGLFDRILEVVESSVKRKFELFKLRMFCMKKEIEAKNTIIDNLIIELDQLKELIKQDNKIVEETLIKLPEVNETLRNYENSPRVPLSLEQQTIARLILEIKRLNNDLRLAISNNRSLKSKNKLLEKKYQDKVIFEQDVNRISLTNLQLQEENNKLKEQLAQFQIEQVEFEKKSSGWTPTFISDFSGIFGSFKNLEKSITLFTYNIGLLVAIVNFANLFSKRGLMPRIASFIFIPVIFSLLYLVIKKATEKKAEK